MRRPHVFAILCSLVTSGGISADHWDAAVPLDQFNLPGDYIIGGLFSIHLASLDSGSRGRPESAPCTNFNIPGYRRFQAMRFAVEEINNSSTLLPGLRLGYRVFDVCSESAAVGAILEAICGGLTHTVPVLQNYTFHYPQFLAVVGPHSSDTAMTIARALGFYSIPLVSYSASSETLAQKNRFPSFFRTIPNDQNQAKALALILKRFNWRWIAILGSDSQYGRKGVDSVIMMAPQSGICVAYKALIPRDVADNPRLDNPAREKVKEIISKLLQAAVNVTIIFAEPEYLESFFSIVIEQNLTGKVWVASESWVQSTVIGQMKNIQSIGTVLGVAVKQVLMPGFKDFISKVLETTNQAQEEALEMHRVALGQHNPLTILQANSSSAWLRCHQNCSHCATLTKESLPQIWSPPERRKSFNSYSAVYALAHALHKLLGCSLEQCNACREIYPWQILQQLKRVNFTLRGQPIYFNEFGDPPTGYEILTWDWTNQDVRFVTIGQYEPLSGDLHINESLISWNRSQVPLSECSRQCQPGQIKRLKGYHSCCFDCEDCPRGTFQNPDQDKCLACHRDQWSMPRSEACSNRTVVYLAWPDPVACILSALGMLGLLVIAGTSVIFKIHLDTPVVKAAGGKLCYLMLSSLTVTCASMGLFIGEPWSLICKIRQPMFAVSFAACVACILVRSFQIVCIFKMAARLPKAYEYWVKYSGQYIFIAAATCFQGIICCLWIIYDTPVLHSDYEFSNTEIYLGCREGQFIGFGVMLSYNSLLCVVCFLFAFMGKNLPKNYNEAKCITISMLAYFISWIFFIFTYSTARGKYIPAFQVFAVLSSTCGILCAYFVPKCYIILYKPSYNTTAYFQSCIQLYTTQKREELD